MPFGLATVCLSRPASRTGFETYRSVLQAGRRSLLGAFMLAGSEPAWAWYLVISHILGCPRQKKLPPLRHDYTSTCFSQMIIIYCKCFTTSTGALAPSSIFNLVFSPAPSLTILGASSGSDARTDPLRAAGRGDERQNEAAYTGVPKVALLDFKNGTNPFPLESYVQHVDT